jgi:hypothetical protein
VRGATLERGVGPSCLLPSKGSLIREAAPKAGCALALCDADEASPDSAP